MDEIRSGIIEDFGLGYLKFGHSELMGRVIGLLICATEPYSIDHICEALNVTKTPINLICRRLEDLKLIKRIRKNGERKYFYQISPDIFLQASINLSRLYEDNLHVAENNIDLLIQKYLNSKDPTEREDLKKVCERLIKMREFNIRQLKAYKAFINEWRNEKSNLPGFEEYLKRIKATAA